MTIDQQPPPVIMVIEDFPETLSMLIDLLSSYKVLAFENGRLALKWIEAHPQEKVDLVISDFNMPGPNGVETLTQIHKLRPAVKTVLMSATIIDDLERVVTENQFNGFLEKPFNPLQLEELLDKVVPVTKPPMDFESPDHSGNFPS